MFKGNPTIVFTLDAGDVDFVKTWAEQGKLPTIARIIQTGSINAFSDVELLNEMGSWPALLSGLSRKTFNYHHVRALVPGTYKLKHTHSLMFPEARPLWCHLQETGKRVLIFDPPDRNTYPDVPGLQIAHWTPHESERMPKSVQAEPASLLNEFLRRYERHSIRAFVPGSKFQTDVAQFKLGLKTIASKGDICLDLLDRDNFDFVLVGFNETHNLSHRLWSHQRSYCSENELSDALQQIYSAIDKQIGRILDRVGGTPNVFIVSAYGMLPGYPTSGLMQSFMEELGYHVLKGSKNKTASSSNIMRGRSKNDFFGVRRALSAAFPFWLQELSISRKLERGTDWAKTRAFAIPSLYTGLIRINLEGREPLGIVPESKYFATLAESKLSFSP